MTVSRIFFVVACAVAVAAGARPARAEDGFADAGDIDAKDGLESATPTDNVNELGGGGNVGGNNANGLGGEGNSPAGEGGSSFDISNTGDDLGGNADGIFDDKPANAGDKGSNVSAFGGDEPINAAKPLTATPPKNAAAKPAPVNNAPPAPANAPAAPVNNTPANSAPALNTPANVPSKEATDGNASLAPQAPAEPQISALPLPPPNEFAGAPPVPGTMRLMAEGEAPEEYLVQPGDTLFDICDQLLSEAGYWPKLWALNPEIKNPHFIFPNMKLRFYPGDDETPPYLQVVTEDDVIPIDKGDLDEQQLVAEKVIFSAETFGDNAAIEVIGPSQVDALQEPLVLIGKPFDGTEIQLQVPGFIFQQAKEPLAFVLGGREGEVSLAPGARAFIEAVSSISPGTLYTVLRTGEKVENPETGDAVGVKYYFVGNIRVLKKVDGELYTAQMQGNNLLTLRPDDIVVPFISTNRTIPSSTRVGALSAAQANVVGFQFEGGAFAGQGQFVFLDKGNGDGVSPGQYYSIYQTPGLIGGAFASELPEDFESIGAIRIIDTTDAGACGYIVRNKREIRVGDRTHKN